MSLKYLYGEVFSAPVLLASPLIGQLQFIGHSIIPVVSQFWILQQTNSLVLPLTFLVYNLQFLSK